MKTEKIGIFTIRTDVRMIRPICIRKNIYVETSKKGNNRQKIEILSDCVLVSGSDKWMNQIDLNIMNFWTLLNEWMSQFILMTLFFTQITSSLR